MSGLACGMIHAFAHVPLEKSSSQVRAVWSVRGDELTDRGLDH
jgi:hypothetical protein